LSGSAGVAREIGREGTIATALATFSRSIARKLGRGGDPEDQIRGPLEILLRDVASYLGLGAVAYGEVRLRDIRARPDYAVDVGGIDSGGTRVGYIEIKAPERGIPPRWRPNAHERAQADKLARLPNVLYTNGQEWAHLSYGQLVAPAVALAGSLTDPRDALRDVEGTFEAVLGRFLLWEPEQPRSLAELIRVVAGLCRLLREEVAAALSGPPGQKAHADLTLLADDWRELLFPDLDDDGFSDAYAQTVAFAMLLARVDGIAFEDAPLHEVARLLGKKHSLMGRALAVLTDGETIDELRTIESFDDGQTDVYVELYERFLAAYDPELRKRSGSYYTPQPVAKFMVDFVDEVLRDRLDHGMGLAADDVVVVDPAMGTGTFLVEVLRSVAATVDERQGPGARSPWLRTFFQGRLVGFEIQAAPYAVAELRLHEALRTRFETEVPRAEKRFLTDALENPDHQQQRLPAPYRVIGAAREEANRVKRDERVMVVIGNPPHVEGTKGQAPWIEARRSHPLDERRQHLARPSLDEFRTPGHHRYESDLYGLPWCFWRWATWKVFEAHDDSPAGIVAFLTPASFLRGRSFAGMREYLRRTCDEGWIIDLSPEGNRPPVSTRVFGAEVGRQLCMTIFARYGGYRPDRPAVVHARALNGSRDEKLSKLRDVELGDDGWASCSTDWQSPLLPEGDRGWKRHPYLADLMPWSSRGVTAGRTWVYASESTILDKRWNRFLRASHKERRALFVESRDRDIDRQFRPLPGFEAAATNLADETGPPLAPVRVAFRSFDRQWLIPDSRLLVMPRPPLWAVRHEGQVFTTEQSNHAIENGPGLTFTELIPDLHHYNARSGKVYPLLRGPDDANLAPGLLQLLRERTASVVTAEDVLAYIAAVVAHGGFTRQFRDELQQPGIRVPLTAEPSLWSEAVELGRVVLWLHTFGNRFVDPAAGRQYGLEDLLAISGPRVITTIPDGPDDRPDELWHDAGRQVLQVGAGEIGPVSSAVFSYEVAGMRVVPHWFEYRRKHSRHRRRSSALDDVNGGGWTPTLTQDLLYLLTVLDRCVDLEPQQADLLERICKAPLITRDDLTDAEILPVQARATRPPPITDNAVPRLL
jgi:Type ISP C-terminal specificity domain/N-6 DNA Methylase